jgi:hypothetical protein
VPLLHPFKSPPTLARFISSCLAFKTRGISN